MKWLRIITAFIGILVMLLSIDGVMSQSVDTMSDTDGSIVNQVVFPHNEVVDVFIDIDEEVYSEMIENAMNEEIVMADITYNDYTFSQIGIRTKGNSSLSQVANSDSDRFSFKVDLDYYIDDQNFYGITKLNLNNIFSDPTMMAEYLGYEMLAELDADASRTTYVALYINDEYKGLYLSVEQVNETFLLDHFDNATGELYKPDMGTGSDLVYISDNGADYTGMFPENLEAYDNDDLVELIKGIEEGDDLESVLNVDSFLKYLAMSTVTIHMDTYQAGMYHNYYLYNNDGVFEWIAWDLNMIFNGFPRTGLTDEEATEFLIDEPVIGAMEKYPLVEAVFENEEYVSRYHDYIEILLDDYLSQTNFTDKVMSTYEMIKDYVEIDPSSFYTYEEFESALFMDSNYSLSLLSFVNQRSANIREQLDGTIPATNNGQGNVGSGGGMRGGGMKNQGDMQPPMQEGTESQMNGEAGKGKGEKLNMENNAGKGGQMNGFPPDINLEDIDLEELPEELRTYIENGEMPPMDLVMAFKDDLPEGLIPAGGFSPGKVEQVQENEPVDMQSALINIGLLIVTSLGMIGFSYYLKKK
ncbi:CotH kinase family protein [Vallitalea okinawensis]|uniref:CotH kinase family protein n=1 Tax=Vallitalea okinawensis TaxID=2078660 RepID=UPI0013002513|nr:CotH kinase family protein [Vallitalea okinawensis]